MDRATFLITLGTVQALADQGVREDPGVQARIGGFHLVLRAMEQHVNVVVSHSHHALPAAIADPTTPRAQALRQYLTDLREGVARLSGTGDGGHGQESIAWAEGARALGAATDLLATYFGPDGSPQSPDTAMLEDPVRIMAALVQAADTTRILLAAHPHLALRAGQAGQPWRKVATALPLLTGLTETVEQIHRTHPGVIPVTGWEHLTVAHPPLRRDDPWAELQGRLHHLRHVAWRLTRQSTPDLRELDAIAASAVILLQGAHNWARGFEASSSSQGRWSKRLEARIAGWSQVRLGLREIRSIPGLAHATLIHPRAFQEVTLRVTAQPEDPRSRGVWELGLETLREVAAYNRATIEGMARGGLLSVRGRVLRGDDISDYPGLVQAKLNDSLAPVPPAHLARISAAYRSAVAPESTVTRRPPSPAVRHREDPVVAR